MRVLVACEESQEVCKAFRAKGHEAYSCDIQECSGGHPEWHICEDVLPLLNGNCEFTTMDGAKHRIDGKWDLIIAHPPCTFLTISGNRWFDIEKYGEAAIERLQDREDGKAFFMRFIEADCDKIAVENPIGIMSTTFRKPDCIIQPWQFGDNFEKTTCLWLKGLPPLSPEVFEKPEMEYFEWIDKKSGRRKRQNMWYYKAFLNAKSAKERQRLRSKTFPGIARAMAEQWGEPRNFVQTEWGEQYTLF